jgi:hypothetical protein
MENLIKKKIEHLLDEQNELRKRIDEYISKKYKLGHNDMLPSTAQEKILLGIEIQMCRDRKIKVDQELKQLYIELNSLQQGTEKPLGTRERNTLLIIIAALATKAKVDINKTTKAGETIEKFTDELGSHVDHGTIEDKLKQIPDALESRKK